MNTKQQAKDTATKAIASVSKAYWETNSDEIKGILMDLTIALDDLLAKLDQGNIAAASKAMEDSVMPGIKLLSERAGMLEGEAKTALEDAMKLSMMSF